MDVSIDFWSCVVEPFTNALKRISLVIITNIIFYYLSHLFRRNTLLDSFCFSLLACCVGVLNIYLFSSWQVINFVITLVITHVVVFEIIIIIWAKYANNILSLKNLNYSLKFWFVSTAFISLKYNHNQEYNIEEFIIPVVTITGKLIAVIEDVLQPQVQNEPNDKIDVEAKTLFKILGYVAFPSWISFKDFQRLPHVQPAEHVRWRILTFSVAIETIFFHLLSHKYVDKGCLGDFWGSSSLLYFIHSFQHRCVYYYHAQLAELEVIALGIRNAHSENGYMFDFLGAESSITMTDFFIDFNIPMSSYVRNALSNGRGLEIFLLYGVVPLVLTASTDIYIPIFWVLFYMCVLTGLLVDGNFGYTRTVWHHFYFVNVPSFRESSSDPFLYFRYGCRYVLMALNHIRLAALFNFKMTLKMNLFMLSGILGVISDTSVISQVLAPRIPQPILLPPTPP